MKVRLRNTWGAWVLLLSAICSAQTPQLPNNTSAAPGFRGQPNGNAPAGEVSNVPVRQLLYPGATTKIYARLMPFFVKGGGESHVDIGYSSNDAHEVAAQVADMRARGLDGAILDWYGPRKTHHEEVAKFLKQEAERQNFEFALSMDNGAVEACLKESGASDANGCVVSDLNYAADRYLSSPMYMRRNGRPVVFFFGLEKYPIDWNYVRGHVKSNPWLVFRNSGAFRAPESDGGFAWIGDSTEPRNGMEYLTRFYRTYKEVGRSRNMLLFGSAYKGFDNSIAGWGKKKKTDQECGRTWLDTFAEINSTFSSRDQLPNLQLITWNDYEEGTELETGIDNCAVVNARVDGDSLAWDIGSGNEMGIDHFEILSGDKRQMQLLQTVARNQRRTRLPAQLPRGADLYVRAVGAPFFQNKISAPVHLR